MNREKTLLEACDHLSALGLLQEVDRATELQREYDGQGCDEGCGLCNDGHPEIICWWHGVARHASCLIPRRIA